MANAARASFPTGCAVSFVEADMTDYIEDCPSESCDVIISTLAIHHLDKEGKAALFAHVYRCLAPGGVFLWGDVYNSVPGSSRDEALQRWSSKMKQYPALTEEERENIWEHASTYDIPEDLPTAEALLNEAGFEGVECLFKDGFYIATWVGRKAVQNGA